MTFEPILTYKDRNSCDGPGAVGLPAPLEPTGSRRQAGQVPEQSCNVIGRESDMCDRRMERQHACRLPTSKTTSWLTDVSNNKPPIHAKKIAQIPADTCYKTAANHSRSSPFGDMSPSLETPDITRTRMPYMHAQLLRSWA